MAKPEYDKLIVYETPPNPFHAPGSYAGYEMFAVNKELVKGASRLNCAWFTGPWPESEAYKPHSHNCDEALLFLGSNPNNPRDLGGEIEFWFEDEKYLFTKSCAIYIPKMLQHAPMFPRRVDRPILFVNVIIGTNDITYYSRDPKWSRFKDPPQLARVAWRDRTKYSRSKPQQR